MLILKIYLQDQVEATNSRVLYTLSKLHNCEGFKLQGLMHTYVAKCVVQNPEFCNAKQAHIVYVIHGRCQISWRQ